MSSDSNKLLCAILFAFLVYLLASFVSELFYSVDKKKVKLSRKKLVITFENWGRII